MALITNLTTSDVSSRRTAIVAAATELVEISFDPELVERDHPIPMWPFVIHVTLSDFRGIARASGGSVEAANEEQAETRVYAEAIEVLAELLAERVKNGG